MALCVCEVGELSLGFVVRNVCVAVVGGGGVPRSLLLPKKRDHSLNHKLSGEHFMIASISRTHRR